MGGSAFDVYRVCERMAAIDLGVATSVLATFLGSDPIVVGGTPDQQALWLGRIAAEGILMAYGATEPEAGSDLGAMKTVAVPVTGDDGTVTAYRITGKKQWISNGGVADLYTILANAPGGPELVRRRPGHPRVRAGQAREQARHPPQQHRRPLPRRGRGAGGPPRRRRRGPGPRPGPARLRLHPADGRRLRAGCRLGGPRPGDPVLGRADPGRQPALGEAGVHPQADRAPRRAAGGGPGVHRGDRRAPRRGPHRPQHRGGDRQVPGDRGRQRRRRRRPSRPLAATATPTSTSSRRSSGTCGSRRSTRGPRRSWR